jgi:hypothetical protein
MPRQPEAKLVKDLQQRIIKAGGYCAKIHGGDNPFQAVGIPDLLCCIHGRFVGLEVKLPGEKLRKMQRVALREIYNAGGVAAVVETVGQGARLLAYLEKEKANEAVPARPASFDRGVVSTEFFLSQ